jgi:hypothetical protein
MSEEDTGNRESPMAYNGGLQVGPAEPGRRDDAGLIYDGSVGFPPGGQARSHGKRARHPPIDCPNVRLMSSFRGFYRCPCCGGKVRLSDDPTVIEAARSGADEWLETLIWAGQMAAWMVRDIAGGVAWICRKLVTKLRGSRSENSGGVAHELAFRLAVMGMIAARYGTNADHPKSH